MTCAACGAVNREGRKFCAECGAALVASCPACGSSNEPGERFCGDCGVPLAAPQTEAPAPPAPEVRRVSVLFCDLVGYTALAEQRDAEDVRAVLSGYFDVARTVVRRYGGEIEKYIGDAVVAVWGVPAAHEDDAERAVRAALDLVDAVPVYGEALGLALQARAGVVTGRAASLGNPLEGIVVGDRVNTAARLQGAAPPGGVLVDAATHEVTVAAIEYADAGTHTLKGKAEQLRLWRAQRVIAGVRGGRRVDELEAPLVGRARELSVVKELFHSCLEERRTRLVALTGQAGVGKSRLHWEFEKHVDGLAFGVLWHTGRCLAYGDGVAYWALAEMVRQRLGIAQEDPPDVVREKLRVGLERWVGDPVARRYVEPRLGVLLGSEDAELPRQELFAGWRLFVEQLAEEAPVVLTFEDMQWADAGLLDFLEQLLDWSPAHRVFVVVLTRPELFDARPSLLSGRRNATAVGVEPLSDAAVGALLDQLVPDLPDRVRTLITGHAAGNPLFVLETIRGLLDRGLVVERDGRRTLVGPIDELQVPATLSALLGARLDALPPDERALVRDLSVFGGSLPRAAVDAMSDLPADAVDLALADLVRRDVLTVRRDPLSPDRGHYTFAQSLLRTVAYDSLSKRERKARHLRAAAHLRAAFPDDGEEVVEVLATHYREAWAAVPDAPDAAAIRDDAAVAFRRAGDRARAVGAPAAAEHAYRAAAELTADEEVAARRLAAAAGAAFLAGRSAEALELYDRVAADHRAAGREDAARALVAPSCEVLVNLRRLAEAEKRLAEALDAADPEDPGIPDWVLGLARVAWLDGEVPVALEHADRALSLAAAVGDPRLLGRAASQRADALAFSGRIDESLLLYRWALDLLGRDGDLRPRLRALSNIGALHLGADRPGAPAVLEEAVELARMLGDVALAWPTLNLSQLDLFTGGWTAAQRRLAGVLDEVPSGIVESQALHFGVVLAQGLVGEVESAREHLAVLAGWRDSADVQARASALAASALVASAEGDLETALAHGGQAARDARTAIGLSSDAVRWGWPVAVDAALRLGRTDDAERLLDLVPVRSPGQVPPFIRAQLSRFRARLAALQHGAGIEERLRTALAELDRLGYPYWRAQVQGELAERLREEGRQAEAAALLEEATGTLTRLGARPALRVLGRD
ncbi:ATP-binding protein [Petropleomorpha daqingensis]|uniref:Class 3 adenylate cyclase/tetratricopeptide (TPR) repeat protein n=1 Tax=Petropleomorpha daqingensis TaxID=2026353 RepID=A0A853CLF3_9ACTN|nr:AAA family ATPase [Petropleomorpha daqingensis]NYJ08904.1 class 3 adenylate cyclase/tetratricopeptide (TPR) repeat protein [Petropleomorpha daqingensis]